MKSKTALHPNHPSDLSGRFIPKDSEDELRTIFRQIPDLNRERLSRAQAKGRTNVMLLVGEHVYRDPATGRLILASEAPQQAFVEGWELAGHQIHEQHRSTGNYDRAIRDGARRSRVQQLRAMTGMQQATGRAPREARNERRRGSRRGERSSASSSDDPDPDPEPAERRFCENERCQRDISRRHPLARYCDDACQQQAYRDRCLREVLDEISGTFTSVLSCGCDPQRNVLEPGHCYHCGKPRGIITREWVDDGGVPARSFVATRGLPQRDLRVRPDRELSNKLRATRGRWDKPERREVTA